jgi:serine/threonine protein kinase
MTVPIGPATTIATAARPAAATSAGIGPARRCTAVYTIAPAHGGRPVDEPGRYARRPAASPGSADAKRPVDTWPLYADDPVRVDGYRLVARLGEGGMADVFYAEAPTGQPVAVKVLRLGAAGPEACLREFRLTSAMDANCTAPALGHGVSTVGAYLVTTYLAGFRCGTTLEGVLLPAWQVWTLGSALARALTAVHARGVVHCDVKPSNLLVRGHDIRLIDFGIARYAGQRCGRDGIVECSRGWAAPEQLRAAPATPAVDVFAWGCLLAYLVGGVHPFASQSDQEWVLRLQSAEPDLSAVPADLGDVIRATLARDPLDRPSAPELAALCLAHGARKPSPLP